jgi:hypothetical protein
VGVTRRVGRLDRPHCLMGLLTVAKPVAVRAEVRIEHGREHLRDGLLNDTVQDRRYAQRTQIAVGLGNHHPAHGRRMIRASQEV